MARLIEELASKFILPMSDLSPKFPYFLGSGLGISEAWSSERLRIPCDLSELFWRPFWFCCSTSDSLHTQKATSLQPITTINEMNQVPSVSRTPICLMQYWPVFEVMMLYECRMKSKARASSIYTREINSYSNTPLQKAALCFSCSSATTHTFITTVRPVTRRSTQASIRPPMSVTSNFDVILLPCFERHSVWSSSTCTMNMIMRVIAAALLRMLYTIQVVLNRSPDGLKDALVRVPGSE